MSRTCTSAQLVKRAAQQRFGCLYSFRLLPIIASFEISRNRGDVEPQNFRGAFEETGFEKRGDRLPLPWRDAEDECVIDAVDEIDDVIKRRVAGNERRQGLKFEGATGFDAVQCGARELECLAA